MSLRLRGTVIHQTEDALGSILVLDHGKHRILSFDTVFEQSKIARGKPHLPVHEYNRAMLLPIAFSLPRRATILGLGGGVLVGALHYLLPECELHAVELRPQVADVARRFFSLPEADKVRLTIADARPALRDMPTASTDFILTDLYGADRMSPAQSQRRFIDECERTLTSEGWLAINYHRMPTLDGRLYAHIRQLFACVLLFKSKTNNYVLYACKQYFEPLGPEDPRLKALERHLPIAWSTLMARVRAA
ncbi:MAG: spermidine synthase [Marinobacter sp.]|uniref:spermidine synthase n=1 Tax=Marinobacter sp. TaxID=50741 RepID=UPI0034A02773